MNLIFFYPSIQFAYEHQINRRISAQAEAGIVVDYLGDGYENLEFQNKRGAKIKAEFRYYPSGLRRNRPNYYASLEPYFNLVNFDREINQTECLDINCTQQFQHRYLFLVKYREEGISFKNGLQINKGWFTVDFSAGLRLRFVNYIKPAIPNGIDDWFDAFFLDFSPNEEKRMSVGIITDVKVGYTLGARTNRKRKQETRYIKYF